MYGSRTCTCVYACVRVISVCVFFAYHSTFDYIILTRYKTHACNITCVCVISACVACISQYLAIYSPLAPFSLSISLFTPSLPPSPLLSGEVQHWNQPNQLLSALLRSARKLMSRFALLTLISVVCLCACVRAACVLEFSHFSHSFSRGVRCRETLMSCN